jgi:hypothetical protein
MPDLPRGPCLSRRRFLAGAAAVAAPWIVPASALGAGGAAPPSERIGVGVIGVGGRGSGHVGSLLGDGSVQVLAVCDANRPKAEANKAKADKFYAARRGPGAVGGACDAYADFREVLARPDVDAVFIASPENWHALQAAAAAEAGKDVYCEKALSLTVEEGRRLCRTVRRHGTVLQVGTQQRSDARFRQACELARNGYLGKLERVEVGVPGGRRLPSAPPTPVPPGLDYDLWLGPAPWTPYNNIKITYNWYFISDYCAGWIESWGVHHTDIALWGAPALAASTLRVRGTAVFPAEGLADTSVTWRVEYATPQGLVFSFSDNGYHPQGVRFIGSEGWVHVRRGGIQAEPKSLLDVSLRPGDERLYESGSHQGNFLECVRTRGEPAAPVEAGHAATTIALVGDIATRLGRPLTWDWKAERFAGDPEADRMLGRAMRPPWVL